MPNMGLELMTPRLNNTPYQLSQPGAVILRTLFFIWETERVQVSEGQRERERSGDHPGLMFLSEAELMSLNVGLELWDLNLRRSQMLNIWATQVPNSDDFKELSLGGAWVP